jgi:sialate O-acetylesterase
MRLNVLPSCMVLLAAALSTQAWAEIRLTHLLTDHAVLQRNRPIHIWGWATPGAALTVRCHEQQRTTMADDAGEWSAWLMPEAAGGPYVLRVSGNGEVTVSDVLVGDVWIASGQSNMEMPLRGFPQAPVAGGDQAIAHATNPRMRLLFIPHATSTYPLDDVQGRWTECTPETAAGFSAVAYFFGREISAREDVPIGLIDSTWGGTPADSWTSMDAYGRNPGLFPAFHARAEFTAETARRTLLQERFARASDEAERQGKQPPPRPWSPDDKAWEPSALYNGMIAPLTPYAVRGFLWYQGESNASTGRAKYYSQVFTSMISDWRMHFAQGDLPFLYVQISSFSAPMDHWGKLRDEQRRALSLSNTAMVISLDRGVLTQIHPPDKETIGRRLAWATCEKVYGEGGELLSPSFRQVTTEGAALRVWFDRAKGLHVNGDAVEGFEVASADRKYVPAAARVDGETVVVNAPAVALPVFVRYGWKDTFSGSLFNGAKLPLGTFSSENDPEVQ